jgi:UDP-N-acetyl-D-mannosaminuronate dehydrogenase
MKVGVIGLGYVGLPLALLLDFRGVTRGIEAANLVRL